MKNIFSCAVFFLLLQCTFAQDSMWYYVPIPTVYLATVIKSGNNNDLFVSSSQGLFLTKDNCKTWNQLSKADSVCPWLWEFVIAKNDYIIGNPRNQNLCLTTNMGSTWQLINTKYDLYNLSIDTTGTLWGRTNDGIYRSHDYGFNWEKMKFPDTVFREICISKKNEIYLAAQQSIYFSNDNGASWRINPVPYYIQQIALNEKGELFLCMGNQGLYVSKDNAKTWEQRYFKSFYFSDMVFDKYGNMFYCDYYDGVFKSKDTAKSWEYIGSKRTTTSLNIHNSILYAGGKGMYKYNYDYNPPAPAKIKYPLCKNNAWQFITGSGSSPVTGGASSYVDLDTLLVIADTVINNNTYYKLNDYPNDWIRYSDTDNKLYVFFNNKDEVQTDFNFTDGAPGSQFVLGTHENWTASITRGFDTVAGVPGNWIIFSGSGSGAMSGITRKYNSGLGYSNYTYNSYHTGSGGSSESLRLIAARLIENGIVKDYSFPYFPVIEINPPKTISDPLLQFGFNVKHKYNILVSTGKSMIYVDSVYFSGFYKKNNSIIGNVKINTTNLEQTYIYMVDTSLSIDLLKDGYAFYFKVIAKDKGLIPKTTVKPDTGYFCITYIAPSSVETESTADYSFSLKQNYPNPANPSSVICYSLPKQSHVKLVLYNALGQILKVLEDTEKPAGNHRCIFNGSGLSSGIYFYRLTADKYTETRKLILMK